MLFERLSERHLPLVDAFHCVESDEQLAGHNAKERRKIKKHSQEMECFLKDEAYAEQELGMNTTYVYLDEATNTILAYVSLCNDAINLELQERANAGITYSTAPALKIARLAVDASCTHRGIGKLLIEFSAFQAQLIREHSGVFFLTLDCYAHRVSFYESVGFTRNLIQPIVLQYDSPISMRVGLDSFLEQIAQHEASPVL